MSALHVALLVLVAAPPDAGAPSATYRVLRKTCRACTLAESAPELAGVPDCGTLQPSANRKRWVACVNEALKAHRPFRAAVADRCGQVFGRSRNGVLQHAWRDAQYSGTAVCGESMILERCSALAIAGAADEEAFPHVDCDLEGDLEFPCSTHEDERCQLGLSDARPAAELRCFSRMDDVSRECAADGGLGWPPVLDGPRLLCVEKSRGLECVPNQLGGVRRRYSIRVDDGRAQLCDEAYLSAVDGTEGVWLLSTTDGGMRRCLAEPGLLKEFAGEEGGVE